jgi:hypothetical protein
MYTNRMNNVGKIGGVPGLSVFGRCLLKHHDIVVEVNRSIFGKRPKEHPKLEVSRARQQRVYVCAHVPTPLSRIEVVHPRGGDVLLLIRGQGGPNGADTENSGR